MNFRRRIRTTPTKQVAAVIRLGCHEFRRLTDLAEQVVAAEIFHEILPVRRDAERNARNFLEGKCRVRRAIREVNVHMIHTAARKKFREVEGIACALLRLDAQTIFLVVLRNELAGPFERCTPRFRILFPDP